MKSSIASDVNIDINLIWEMEGGDYVFRRPEGFKILIGHGTTEADHYVAAGVVGAQVLTVQRIGDPSQSRN